MSSDPKIIAITFLGGIIPSLLWLWFWLNEDKKKPEPKEILTIVFILGGIAVLCVLPIQTLVKKYISLEINQLILWASIEEIFKYLAVMIVLYKTTYAEEPIDWPIYLITGALGFAALENILFLIKPISSGNNIVGLLTGGLRFLGSTLLHAVASGLLGIALGLSMRMNEFSKKIYFILGILVAITLHVIFNFFIIKDNGSELMRILGFLWVITVLLMLLFEKLRRMN